MIKVAFVTCVQIGLSCIEEIYKIEGKLDLLITLHDKKAKKKSGRIYLDDFSRQHNIPLVKINNVNDQEVVDTLEAYDIDWLFIIGWSQIAYKNLTSVTYVILAKCKYIKQVYNCYSICYCIKIIS